MSALTVAVDATSAWRGGGIAHLSQQLPALSEAGVQLIVFASEAGVLALEPHVPAASFVTVRRRPLLSRLAFVHLRLDRAARRMGADVLYCPGSSGPALGSLPVVVCVQNAHLFSTAAPRSVVETARRIASWITLVRAHTLVFISDASRVAFEETAALDIATRVVLSGPGGPVVSVAARGAPSDDRRRHVLAVSNLYRHKRMDLLVRAHAADPRVRDSFDLVIAGDEIELGIAEGLRRLAHAIGSGDAVRVVGFVETAELRSLYEDAVLYVSLSEDESFGLTPAEALQFGLPVLLSDIPVFRELYHDWATFTSSEDPEQVAAAMLDAIARGAPIDQGSGVADRFSWRANAEETAAILREASTSDRPRVTQIRTRVVVSELPNLLRALVGRRRTRTRR